MANVPTIDKEYSSRWAYDISKRVIAKGEIFDTDVIDQSIEMILTTYPTERFFNPSFGSLLLARIFEVITDEDAEVLLDDVAEAIKTWEDRVFLIEKKMRIDFSPDDGFVILTIPYVVRRTGLKSTFQKKIINS